MLSAPITDSVRLGEPPARRSVIQGRRDLSARIPLARPSRVPSALVTRTNSAALQRCGGHACHCANEDGPGVGQVARARPSGGGLRSSATPPSSNWAIQGGVDSTLRDSAQRVPASVHETLRASGQPLDKHIRDRLEPRFGYDFAAVRLHTGASAAASAKEVGAQAYTVGSHVVLASGAYAPPSRKGLRLLAHELAHVIQQRNAGESVPQEVSKADDPAELSADQAAEHVLQTAKPLASSPVSPGTGTGFPVLRQTELWEQAGEAADVESDTDEAHDGDTPVVGSSAGGLEEEMATMPYLAESEAGGQGGRSPSPGKPGAKPSSPGRWITRISVDLSSQGITLTWSDGTSEGPRPISSGRGRPGTAGDPCKEQTEENCTPAGSFKVGFKGDADTKNKEGDKMSWYVEFVPGRGIGIHDSQRVSKGHPLSHGCVRVGNTPADDAFAKKVNQNSRTGKTEVVVTGKAPTKRWTKPVKRAASKK
jgi:hypothetical protein